MTEVSMLARFVCDRTLYIQNRKLWTKPDMNFGKNSELVSAWINVMLTFVADSVPNCPTALVI
jgi:hypothetical protein